MLDYAIDLQLPRLMNYCLFLLDGNWDFARAAAGGHGGGEDLDSSYVCALLDEWREVGAVLGVVESGAGKRKLAREGGEFAMTSDAGRGVVVGPPRVGEEVEQELLQLQMDRGVIAVGGRAGVDVAVADNDETTNEAILAEAFSARPVSRFQGGRFLRFEDSDVLRTLFSSDADFIYDGAYEDGTVSSRNLPISEADVARWLGVELVARAVGSADPAAEPATARDGSSSGPKKPKRRRLRLGRGSGMKVDHSSKDPQTSKFEERELARDSPRTDSPRTCDEDIGQNGSHSQSAVRPSQDLLWAVKLGARVDTEDDQGWQAVSSSSRRGKKTPMSPNTSACVSPASHARSSAASPRPDQQHFSLADFIVRKNKQRFSKNAAKEPPPSESEQINPRRPGWAAVQAETPPQTPFSAILSAEQERAAERAKHPPTSARARPATSTRTSAGAVSRGGTSGGVSSMSSSSSSSVVPMGGPAPPLPTDATRNSWGYQALPENLRVLGGNLKVIEEMQKQENLDEEIAEIEARFAALELAQEIEAAEAEGTWSGGDGGTEKSSSSGKSGSAKRGKGKGGRGGGKRRGGKKGRDSADYGAKQSHGADDVDCHNTT